ncbi:MAG: hypothetical protein GY705_22110 [Bacteroidetes bacterium]|nr:hypothetical protein [Bacteroidota bacterium]
MKMILMLIITIFLGLELEAQSITDARRTSLELNFGIGKVGFIGENDFVVDGIQCFDCDYQIIKNEGYEFNSRFTSNRTFNIKHEVLFGLGVNIWSYNVDVISGWTGKSLDSHSNVLGLFDIILGYRYVIKELKEKSFFIENMFHGELNSGNKFNRFKFSFEPGLGLKIMVNDSLKFLSILSYKHSITDFSTTDNDEQNPYSFGVKLGISKTL